MFSLPTMIEKDLKEAVPEKGAWVEAWGFVLCGLGLLLALACYSFSPYDYSAKLTSGLHPKGVANLVGPFGAYMAAHVLGRFGVIGMVWPVAFFAWGVLTATGFVTVPRPRRFLGFFTVTTVIAGLFHVLLPFTALPEPSFGYGGLIGTAFGGTLQANMGVAGAVIALAIFGFVMMVLTGNMSVSGTADAFRMGVYHTKRFGRKAWVKYVLNQDTSPAQPKAQAQAAQPSATDVHPAERVTAKAAPAPAPAAPAFHLELYYDAPAALKPEPAIFMRTKKAPDRSSEFATTAANLTQQLAEFKIVGEMQDVTQGPVVTTYEFKPAPGTKVSKISALGEDLARLLKAQSLRVLAPIPGKDTVGFEVPNAERAVIGFGDLIDNDAFRNKKHKLPIAMGVDIFGAPVIEDMAEMPHLLVAGSTGSGKSVFMNTLVGSLIARHSAKDLRFVMIDPKMVEMAAYNTLPHMATPVITDVQTEAKAALNALVYEMEDRYRKMRAVGARNIDSFNEIVKTRKKSEFLDFEGRWASMPFIVLIIDEMADMMMLLGREAETPITRLAQKARAAGIHMVIATQRPSADVVTGLIKANFPTRVAFRVLSGVDSRTILDQNGAEGLLGKGDMLYLASGGARRLHGAYLSESEVHAMVKVCAKKK